MAASSHPVRSISLPARSHPTSLKIEETINKLKSRDIYQSDSTSCYTSGSDSIQLGLLNLVELYARVQELVSSLSSQHGKLVEEALESSVSLLDTCSIARDLISGFKEQVCDLQSALRRKGSSGTEKEINIYMSFRKKVSKEVSRCLKVLKQAEAKYGITAPLLDNDPSLVNLNRLLRETYTATIVVFKSLFLFLSTPTKPTKWSLISKLVTKNSISKEAVTQLNEVSGVDSAIQNESKVDVMLLRGKIQALDSSLQILEGEVGCLFRCLLQNRVSLLNILTQSI
ncbi:hypothetical protein SOVF_074810 [Spinacia oleracea]|uniref:Uncharacterized protein n=1 Tax=Spinacia oleracea TaxID=3562 RepID=A0A9R0JJU9_SPIOL|nr:uncharacterized protein LOC110776739 [Spinacia oleracea]KNA17986.1 hypothetical protein SOVF_074810 [Spinacia oleracea]